ncbi:MAG: protein tyrosine phosphatase family protein [Rhodothermia bacterium]|nr:protein tyrosine phosphatase family protein [Rhodothermia bacterium]
MRKRSIFSIVVLLVVGFGTSACELRDDTAIKVETSGAEAVRLEGWASVNNLFTSGRMYFGGQPDQEALVRLATAQGVKTVVNIRFPEEMGSVDFNEQAVAESLGLRYVTIPVSPGSFSQHDVDRFAQVLGETDEPVLLHCASSNRVGGMWAAYLSMHRGVEPDDALELGRSAGLRSEGMVAAVRRVADF